ncbi:saccharopine dehydrogenase [Streptomyces sp. LP05-1]|uniref:Saccharopine dehydrogenase [NAD(+), L-lysine-forming] n=1 Tax=Streptomyces pyxinae TaxID=2970734 RepID=A0ABT2CBC2_9ACTN|nr:saccharopine dehydrogenase [Streptomyces sp. LP05-1]MCS0634705.1 saccharopine dehydrogenase [Streptomyces sp. LP05-1]
MPQLWIRHETRPTERRAPVVPRDAAVLTGLGVRITVEESPRRVFSAEEYAAAGCALAPAGSWPGAPGDAYVLGLKELPGRPERLRHRHIFFGHAYKGQPGAGELLDRFTAGGGTLLDLEYLTDAQGARRVAFGYWAGYAGAALALLTARGRLTAPLRPLDRASLDAELRGSREAAAPAAGPLSAVVIGALGRSGRGACDALRAGGVEPTRWDLAETRELDREALLSHDILVSTVLVTRPVPPFLTTAGLGVPGRLSVVADITCDIGSGLSVLPFNDRLTDWRNPVRRVPAAGREVRVIAIDNLPSLLPAEASTDFSADLARLLPALDTGPDDPVGPDSGPAAGRGSDGGDWARCRAAFTAATEARAAAHHSGRTDV